MLWGHVPSPMTHGSCTAVALPEGHGRPGPEISCPSGNQGGAGVVSSVNTVQGVWCAEKRRHLSYLCENRNCGRPPSGVVAADNVCVLSPCVLSSAHLPACSNLPISLEGASVYKLHQRWSFLNIRCSVEPAQRKGGASGHPVLDRKLWLFCLVLSFFLFVQMQQHTRLCKAPSCLMGKSVTELLCYQL